MKYKCMKKVNSKTLMIVVDDGSVSAVVQHDSGDILASKRNLKTFWGINRWVRQNYPEFCDPFVKSEFVFI